MMKVGIITTMRMSINKMIEKSILHNYSRNVGG